MDDTCNTHSRPVLFTPAIAGDYTQLLSQLNDETLQHSYSVSNLCAKMAGYLHLDDDIARKIGLLHDVGKLYIPARILKKNGKLTDFEREIIDLHSYFSYRILSEAGEDEMVTVPILYHHGFNKVKLGMEEIPVSKKMLQYIFLLHTADVYDAMASKRIYHDPFPYKKIRSCLLDDGLCPPDYLKALEYFIKDRGVEEKETEDSINTETA